MVNSKHRRKRFRIGITMGDPAGIGPEIILKTLFSDEIPGDTELIIFGNPFVFKDQGTFLSKNVYFRTFHDHYDLILNNDKYTLIDPTLWKDNLILPGQANPSFAKGILHCIDTAVMWTLENKIQAIVTAPINKSVIRLGGYSAFTGHTEYLARLTGAKRPIMMLANDNLKVIQVTTHLPFSEIISSLSRGLILDTLYQAHTWFQQFYHIIPRLAIAALNPHAGEDGTLGNEEVTLLQPAISKAKQNGVNIEGPFPADSVFSRAITGEFDAVLALYHDQGMIPVKLLPNSVAVNITLGLPIIRTSVDHGTAFDIAGKGKADIKSLIKAILMARELIKRKLTSK